VLEGRRERVMQEGSKFASYSGRVVEWWEEFQLDSRVNFGSIWRGGG